MKYVTLTTVDDVYQAHFLGKALEDEGIQCMEVNENINTILPFIRPGIQVRVTQTDYDRARVICERVKALQGIVCPNCKSDKVEYLGSELKELSFALTLVFLFFAAAPKKNVRSYLCSICDTRFKVK
jgi:hypothetical protein